jgi:hypothetical protein
VQAPTYLSIFPPSGEGRTRNRLRELFVRFVSPRCRKNEVLFVEKMEQEHVQWWFAVSLACLVLGLRLTKQLRAHPRLATIGIIDFLAGRGTHNRAVGEKLGRSFFILLCAGGWAYVRHHVGVCSDRRSGAAHWVCNRDARFPQKPVDQWSRSLRLAGMHHQYVHVFLGLAHQQSTCWPCELRKSQLHLYQTTAV